MSLNRPSINLLSPELRNQIAAGEVVERPASVLKELVENALDAKATQITIHLENGGQSLIKVQDNGYGIDKDELELAVTRHATSKIQNLNDLLAIYSYGFRGEALPSIASVSRFTITSTLSHDQDKKNIGHCLQVEFGQIKNSSPAPLPQGTVIEVRDLFANIPARLKFLKSPSTENKKAQEWLTRLAIAKNNVGFTLYIGERESLRLAPEQSLAERLNVLWPPLITESLRDFDNTHHGIRTHGMASLPHTSQPRADRILFYVNGRAVQDKTLLAAVREAYKGRLTTKDYPQVVLFIEINPEEIDVNVHPAKTEIRFRDTSSVFSAVRRGILSMLEANNTHFNPTDTTHITEQRQHLAYDENSHTARPQGFWGRLDSESIMGQKKYAPSPYDTQSTAEYNQHQSTKPHLQAEGYATNAHTGLQEDSAHYGPSLNNSVSYEQYAATAQAEFTKDDEITTTLSTQLTAEIGNMQYWGQIANTYLVLRAHDDSLILLDQHAMHERILFARMQADALVGSGQLLALPLELSLHPSEVERAISLQNILKKLGFELELAQQVMYIKALPTILNRHEAQSFLREALAGRKDDLNALFISFACKAAIKAGQKLTTDEVMGLIKQWLNTDEREYCPHGRPCVLRLSSHELEKMFKRK